jgi:TetR/AcrR family transcriptional regulator, transcriptional repressor for nem operon
MDTRTALLNAAEHAARARGYDGFSYADIATEVGIRKASIHHHFPTKADLVLALLERYCAQFMSELAAISQMSSTAGIQLRAYVAACRTALGNGDLLCLCVALCVGRDTLSEPILSTLNNFNQQTISWLFNIFATGQNDGSIKNVFYPEREAHTCFAQMQGGLLIARASKKLHLFDAATELLLARIH